MNDDPTEEEAEEEQEQEPVPLDDSSFHTFPYVCKQCGNEWTMNYYDIMRLTDRHEMPCGCGWSNLDYKKAVYERRYINEAM